MNLVLFPSPDIAPRAVQRIGDGFDDLRQLIATAPTVADVYPLLDDLRAIAKEALQLVDRAADRAEYLMREDV